MADADITQEVLGPEQQPLQRLPFRTCGATDRDPLNDGMENSGDRELNGTVSFGEIDEAICFSNGLAVGWDNCVSASRRTWSQQIDIALQFVSAAADNKEAMLCRER